MSWVLVLSFNHSTLFTSLYQLDPKVLAEKSPPCGKKWLDFIGFLKLLDFNHFHTDGNKTQLPRLVLVQTQTDRQTQTQTQTERERERPL